MDMENLEFGYFILKLQADIFFRFNLLFIKSKPEFQNQYQYLKTFNI